MVTRVAVSFAGCPEFRLPPSAFILFPMPDFLIPGKTPLLAETDVLVIGAGSAGCCAAMAAAEGGRHRVLLVERYGFAGGTSTQMLDTFYGFFTPGDSPRKVVGGIPDRVVDALDNAGAVFLRPNTYGAGAGVNYNPERLKLVWDELLAAAGVRVLLHAALVDAGARDGAIHSVVIWTKRGFFRIAAKRFIDASGDADLCHLAGIPYEKAGDLEPAQTLTTTFRMSNVNLDAYEKAGGKTDEVRPHRSGRHRPGQSRHLPRPRACHH